jgi:hypothetical protein
MRTRLIGRDAITGQFISLRQAHRRAETAITESYRISRGRTLPRGRRRSLRAGGTNQTNSIRKSR